MRGALAIGSATRTIDALTPELPARLDLDALGARLRIHASSDTALARLARVYGWFVATGQAPEPPAGRMALIEAGTPAHRVLKAQLKPNDPLGLTAGHLLVADWLDHAFAIGGDHLLHYYASKFVRLRLVACHEPEIMTLHAASLDAGNGMGLLLVGEAASGKTTLTLRLIDHGFLFCSDDTSCIRRADQVCVPFPLAFVLRSVPRGAAARRPDIELLDEPRWLLPRFDAVGAAFHPRQIVFLHDRPDAPPGRPTPLSPARAALMLLRNVVVPLGAVSRDDARTISDFDTACAVAERAACLEINSTDLDRTCHALMAMAGRRAA